MHGHASELHWSLGMTNNEFRQSGRQQITAIRHRENRVVAAYSYTEPAKA